MHEHISKHEVLVTGSSNRVFGLVFATVFLIFAIFPILFGGNVRYGSLGIASGFMLAAFFVPGMLTPANNLWMKFGNLLHRIVSPVALGFVFYLTVMPTGLLMRLFGMDPLRLRFDPAVESYWIRRNPPGPDASSLNNQF
jgi:hypothetical protein